jgi:LysR family nitrogen assimilation transcriptional regulator
VLYRHAEVILRHVESAKHDAASALNVPSGRVTIGFPVVLTGILSFALFARVRSLYPQILLHVSDANAWILRERLANGRLDIALLFEGQPERGLAVEPLLDEELFYLTADLDPSPIRMAEAARHPLLLAGPGSSSRHVAQEAFKAHGLTVTPVAEIDSLITLRRAIASGIGNGIQPWCALHDGDRHVGLHCRRFADARLARPVSLCFSDVGQRSPAVEAVARTLKSLVYELVETNVWKGVSLIASADETPVAAAGF